LVWPCSPEGTTPADNHKEVIVTEPHSHQPPPAEPDRGSGLTGYAIAKYGIILIIVVVVLWFVANYFLGD
jgi:hypothetical protein